MIEVSSKILAEVAALITAGGGWVRWGTSPTKNRIKRIEGQLDAIYKAFIPEYRREVSTLPEREIT